MKKHDALAYFDGSVKTAATEIGCSQEAIRMWPDPLTPRIRDRVQAALWRRGQSASTAAGQHDDGKGGEAMHGGTVGAAAAAVHQHAEGVR